jgi:outer membrane protein assembly factor BamB
MSARPQIAVRFAGLAVLAGLAGLAGLMLAAQPALARPSGPGSAPVAGSQLWADVNGLGGASATAVSPDSDTVFVTGAITVPASGSDYLTVAYDASTGAQLWSASYNGPANGNNGAVALAVSPDGRTVFVTGSSASVKRKTDYATVAYDASTGAQLWVARYNGLDGGGSPTAIAVDPAGQMVFVTGTSPGGVTTYGDDCATVAYDAATGAQVWARRFAASVSRAADC